MRKRLSNHNKNIYYISQHKRGFTELLIDLRVKDPVFFEDKEQIIDENLKQDLLDAK